MTACAEQRFDTGQMVINYAEGPAVGTPLVLLHGGSARWQAFDNIIPDLAARWHLFAPDLRGHGKSGWAPGHYRLLDFAGDISAFLSGVVKEPAFLVGHSPQGLEL